MSKSSLEAFKKFYWYPYHVFFYNAKSTANIFSKFPNVKIKTKLTQKKVKNVIYPTNHQGEIKERAKRYMQGGYGSLVGMDVGTREAGAKFIDNLKMLYHVANIGDARSLAIHPATTTHSQLNDEELLAAGVTPGYVRLSIGIEHPDDIIGDIKQALAA